MIPYDHPISCYQQPLCEVSSTSAFNHTFVGCCGNTSNSIKIDEYDYCVTICLPAKCFKYSDTCETDSEEVTLYKGDDINSCCQVGRSLLVLNTDDNTNSICLKCLNQTVTTFGVGMDPHFSVLLSSGHQLCFTIQGEQGFVFNLVHSPLFTMNALFVEDKVRKDITWIGTLAVIFHNPRIGMQKMETLRFEASSRTVHINEYNTLIVSKDHGLHLIFDNGKTDSSLVQGQGSVVVNVKEIGLKFSVEFVNNHLDVIYDKISPFDSRLSCHYEGLLGQFFCPGYSIDRVRKVLLFPSDDREPVPVSKRHIWSFLERENGKGLEKQMCWMAMNSGMQGEGLLHKQYLEYILPDLFSSAEELYQ